MRNKKFRRLTAIALSACMLLGAGTIYFAEDDSDKSGQVNLALAQDDEPATEEAAAVDEKQEEPETEEKIVYDQLETTNTQDAAITAIDVSQIVETCMPSIVAITTSSIQEVESYFYGRQEYEVEGAGSGIIIAQNDTELLIATNNHIVSDAKEMTVCFSADSEDPDALLAPAVVKGTNSKWDLAVIAVALKDINSDVLKQLRIATLGKSSDIKVGETAIVIGNALATGQTVTCGIVSALDREITTEVGTFTEIQVDAAINFGCSGGAILNGKGEVIGITDAKAVDDNAESMGYGIPIDSAIPVLQDLINRETREVIDKHGYLGITVVPVSEEASQMYNMPAGAFVYEVTEGSAAEKAGIKKGDIITKFDGIDISSSDELVKTIAYYEAGETIKVEVQTAEGGSYNAQELEVTLQEGAPEAEADDEKAEEKPEEKQEEQPETDENQEQDNRDEYRGEDNYDYYDPFGLGDFGQFFFGDGYGWGDEYSRGNDNGYGRGDSQDF